MGFANDCAYVPYFGMCVLVLIRFLGLQVIIVQCFTWYAWFTIFLYATAWVATVME